MKICVGANNNVAKISNIDLLIIPHFFPTNNPNNTIEETEMSKNEKQACFPFIAFSWALGAQA